MKFAFYTLGCKTNQYETQAMEQLFVQLGHSVGSFDGVCDGYIINTCSVTAVADKKNRAVIRRCRRENPNAVIGVCGCYTQHAPEAVREHMEKADVFVFSSDFNEGWGAVLNESMNSGCAVIANRMIGAVPFLINHGENGYWYRKSDAKALKEILTPLLDDRELCESIGKRAYKTIVEEWNPRMAAERLLQLCEDVVAGQKPQIRWESGPCSKAEIIKERS